MSESKTPWTPGPWDVSGLIVYDTCLDAVASVNDAADARLIACAPEMAEALEVFSRALGSVADTDTTHWPDNNTIEHSGAAEEITWGDLRRARALLAKIGGQS